MHTVEVKFYGRMVQSEYIQVTWSCTRNDMAGLWGSVAAFTCRETGGKR